MTTLVLGAQGFLGSETLRSLIRRRIEVVGVARAPDADVQLDLRDLPALQRVLEEVRPTAIVNCAVRADFSQGVLPDLYAINVLVPGVLAEWVRSADAHLIHIGATLVHGARTERIGSASPIVLDTDYGRSKWLADELIMASGCRASILRLGGIYGTGGPKHLGLNRAISDARRGKAPTLSGTGSARRSYIHVHDAAETVTAVVERRLEGIHYVAGTTHTIADYLRSVRDVFLPGAEIEVSEGPEAHDQTIEPSPGLPEPRPPRVALANDRDRS